eukprot:s3297_g5.t1
MLRLSFLQARYDMLKISDSGPKGPVRRILFYDERCAAERLWSRLLQKGGLTECSGLTAYTLFVCVGKQLALRAALKSSLPVLRTGSGAAMTSSGTPFWKDGEIVVDRDGIPHFTGAQPYLMKEYRRRVLFAYNTLEGEGDTEAKEQADLERKRRRFAKKLLDALHGEAWRACQDLLTDMEKLRAVDGYKHVFSALQKIEKVSIVKKTEQFDKFFERGFRKRGQPLDQYLRARKQDWADLKDLDENTNMSEDLLAYFVLKHCNLSKDDRRQILLNNASVYNLSGIEQAMRVSFYDIHEREKVVSKPWDTRSKSSGKGRRGMANYLDDDEAVPDYDEIPEDEEAFEEAYWGDEIDDADVHDETYGDDDNEVSDAGASNDDEVFNAYKAMDQQRRSYRDSRKRLKEIQKSRGFYKHDGASDDRQRMNNKEKERSRCAACDRIGHWAGDPQCPKSSKSGPKKFQSKPKGKGKGKKSGAKSYYVNDGPTFFTLGDPLGEDESQFCNMVHGKNTDKPLASDSEWSHVSGGYTVPVAETPMPSSSGAIPSSLTSASGLVPGQDLEVRQMPVTVSEEGKVKVVKVSSFADVKPKQLDAMKQKDLREMCDKWDIHVSGNKEELTKRLSSLFMGMPVARKGCTRQFIMLEEESGKSSEPVSDDVNMKKSRFREEAQSSGPASSPADQPSGSGIFRSSGTQPGAVLADLGQCVPKSKMPPPTWCPKMQPEEESLPFKPGDVLPHLPCMGCGGDMLFIQDPETCSWFMGCANHYQNGCTWCMDYVTACRAEAAAAARHQRGGGSLQ